MVEKKAKKNPQNKINTKTKASKIKTSKITKSKSAKSKNKKVEKDQFDDASLIIVDDDIKIDQEKINEERRAYLEEARSQETSD